MPSADVTWSGSLHQTFRLLPGDRQSANLRPFLQADGLTPDALLKSLPYDRARARGSANAAPDPKRYRDGRQVYQTVGLLYEEGGTVHVTDLGRATLRWLGMIRDKNRVVLARHAAYALAACQLRNPTGAGEKYAAVMTVFPFAFIWRAMLALDGRISSDELNRSIFKVQNEAQLSTAIESIQRARDASDVSLLGPETITGEAKNDRIIPWVSLASFGWTLFADKGNDTHYKLDPATQFVVREAARIRHPHKDFPSVRAYIEHVSRCAALPKDLR